MYRCKYRNNIEKMLSAKEKISLLQKIMNDSEEVQNQDTLEEKWQKLHQAVDILCEWVKKTHVKNKDKCLQELETALHKTDVLRLHHQMIGDSFIGIIGTETNFLGKIIPVSRIREMNEIIRADLDIPVIITSDANFSISLQTVYDKQIPVAYMPELHGILKDIKEVDISKIINYIYVCDSKMSEYTTAFYFPSRIEIDEGYTRRLMQLTDIYVASWNGTDMFAERTLESFIQICIETGKTLYISVISKKEEALAIEKIKAIAKEMKRDFSYVAENIIIVKSEKEIIELITQRIKLNTAFRNYSVFEPIAKIILSMYIEIERLNRMTKEQKNKSTKDEVELGENSDTLRATNKALIGDRLTREYKESSKFLNELMKRYEDIKKCSQNLEKEFENIVYKNLKEFEKIKPLQETVDDWISMAISCAIAYMHDETMGKKLKQWGEEYVTKVEKVDETRSVLLKELYKKLNRKGKAVIKADYDQKIPDTMPMSRLVFLLHDELGVTEEQLVRAAGAVVAPQTEEEFYYRGCFYEENNLFEEAYYCYRQSIDYCKWIKEEELEKARRKIKELIIEKKIRVTEEEGVEFLSPTQLDNMLKKINPSAENSKKIKFWKKINEYFYDKELPPSPKTLLLNDSGIKTEEKAKMLHKQKDYKGEFDLLRRQIDNADAQYNCGKLLYEAICTLGDEDKWLRDVASNYFPYYDDLYSMRNQKDMLSLFMRNLFNNKFSEEENYYLYQAYVDIEAFFLRAYKLKGRGKSKIDEIDGRLMEILGTEKKDIINLNEGKVYEIQRLKFFGGETLIKEFLAWKKLNSFYRLSDLQYFSYISENRYREIIEKAMQDKIIIKI